PGVSDIGLGVKFFLSISTTLDFPRLDGCNDGRHSGQEIVLFLFSFETIVHPGKDFFEPFDESGLGPARCYLVSSTPYPSNGANRFQSSRLRHPAFWKADTNRGGNGQLSSPLHRCPQ